MFFAPLNLLWLLLLPPIIIFFYLLKLKRREKVISSVLLWSRLVQDVQANAPFQKLKRNLLLLLQLLIVLLLVFALARPAFFQNALGGNSVVVILDGSASMQSRDGRGGTRFEEARSLALQMVGRMRGGDRMMVLLASARTHRLSSFTADGGELRRALSTAQPRDTSANLRDAILLASSIVGSSEQYRGSRIYLISDGAYSEMEEIDTRGAELEFVKVGSRSHNVGIVATDVRRKMGEAGGYQLFVAVRNYYDEPQRCNLELYHNDALIDVRRLELPAAAADRGFSEHAEVVEDLGELTGILEARLDINDDLPADNVAYAQLTTRREIQVLLVTDGNLYLEKALNLDPHVQLSKVAPAAYEASDGFDVVVFDGHGPQRVGPGNHLYINCGGATAPVEIRGQVKEASLLDWDRSHPVMRYVRLNQLYMPEALIARTRPWAVTLAEHEEGPVIAIGETGGVRSAYLGFPLLQTDFPLRVAFPIFVNNVVQWLGARPGQDEGLQLRTGETAMIEVPDQVDEVVVIDPTGSRHSVKPEGRLAYFSDTERRGIYQVEAARPSRGDGGDFRQEFAVNLLNRRESANKPAEQLQFGRRPVTAGTGSVRTAREFWRWLVLLALLVLAIEWWVYHRRI
jgi:Ca-activated chloride channel homolog